MNSHVISTKGSFRLPISLRLTLWYGLSMLVLLALFSGLLLTSYHLNQHSLLHQRLFGTQSELIAQIDLKAGVPRLDPSLAQHEGALRMDAPFGTYVRLLSPEGAVLDQSANFHNQADLRPSLPAEPRIEEVSLHWQRRNFRAMYAPVLHSDELVGWLEVSAQSRGVEHQLAGWPVAVAILFTMSLALLGGYLLARHALRPVVRLTEAANEINAAVLNIRLPTDAHLRDELTDLAETFNTMLARLQASFEREQRFTANAAHELLNPLAAVRNEAEVTLRRSRTPDEYQQTLQKILSDAQRLGRLVEQLLDLARLEAGSEIQGAPVKVAEVCREKQGEWEELAVGCGINLQCDVQEHVVVAMHRAHLETLFHNLLENALKYTSSGGWVTLSVAQEEDMACLAVGDSGIGFEPEIAEQLFDRFYRADTSDVQAHPGNGLGLAIVQAITRAYGGTLVAISAGPGQGSLFTVRIPTARKRHS